MDCIQVTFSIVTFLGQAAIYLNLPIGSAKKFPQSIRVSVPSFLLAASAVITAEKNTSYTNPQLSASSSSQRYIELSDSDSDVEKELIGNTSSDTGTDIEWGEITRLND